MSRQGRPLQTLLAQTRDLWDRDTFRPHVRGEFSKAVRCGTLSLGAEVFASANGERVVPHTCKSRACPSCGHKATLMWQRDLEHDLPEVPYMHLSLTMPDVLWPLFRRNRRLLHDLAVLGAHVLQRWTKQRYGIRRLMVVFPHTFGRHLNFNCHLHILISEGGLDELGTRWRGQAPLNREAVMRMWQYAVITYLRQAHRAGLLIDDRGPRALVGLLRSQYERWWNVHVQRFQDKAHVLRYAGRYARKPPIAQHRLRHADRNGVRFQTKDTRTKQLVDTVYATEDFLAALADHLPDRYRHNVRYFGLLAPRLKAKAYHLLFARLGQRRQAKPSRLSWATEMQRAFGIDPLVDSRGERFTWVRSLPPLPAQSFAAETSRASGLLRRGTRSRVPSQPTRALVGSG